MSTFDEIARRVIVESNIERYGIVPEFVIDAWIASRYKRVLNKIPFGSINSQGDSIINTSFSYNTGSVNLIEGSQVLEGVGTVFNIDMISKYFRPAGGMGWYRIIDFVDTTHLTLDAPFADLSRSNVGYYIAQRFYLMPTTVRWIIDGKNSSRGFRFVKIHRQELDRMFPSRISSPGVPLYWSPAGWEPLTGQRIIEIYPFANIVYRFEFSGYANVDEPSLESSPIPDMDDRVLMEGALSDALRFSASKEDDVVKIRGMLDLAASHERIFGELMEEISIRDSRDAPGPRVTLMHKTLGHYGSGYWDPIMTARDDIMQRSPY